VTVAEVGERELLRRIRALVPAPPAGVLVGIGDDAAVLATTRNRQLVLTADTLVEGTHFDPRYSSWHDVGRKAAAVNLSDLASMGARPEYLLCSLVLAPSAVVAAVEDVTRGLVEEAGRVGARLVGGNLTRTSGPMVIDVTATGTVAPRRVLTRGGARAGDELWVSGTVGSGLAGLQMLQAGVDGDPGCVARYRTPEARVRLGQALGATRAARAAMDLSDGLADAVRQVAAACGCGAAIDADAVPIAPAARAWFTRHGHDPVLSAVAGGDDYELLVAVPPKGGRRLRAALARVGTPLTRIGVLTASPALVMRWQGREAPLPEGYEHFTGPC
jgi:thiamine-monophosphate kinase